MSNHSASHQVSEDGQSLKVVPDAVPAAKGEGPVDNEWMIREGFQQSAKRGFELLFIRYHKLLCSHAARFVYSEAVAQDIVSEVFCRLWKTKAYEGISTSYRFYLFRSVRNEAYNYIRLEFQPTEQLEVAEGFVSGQGNSPDTMAQYEEVLCRVEKIVQQLPPQCRRVFLMSRFEGKKYKEIADELEISIKTVEVHMGRALQSMRQGLQEHWI